MATKLLGLIIAAGLLWSPVRSHCLTSTCKLRSYYRFKISNSSAYSFMKVEVGSGNQHGVAFVGKRSQPNYTEFLLERCTSSAGLVYTMQWNLRPSYFLAVKNGRVELEQATSVTDDHRFVIASTGSSRSTFESKSASKYLQTNRQGQVSLGTNPRSRKAWFNMMFCT